MNMSTVTSVNLNNTKNTKDTKNTKNTKNTKEPEAHPKRGCRWSLEEENRILDMLSQNNSLKNISQTTGRTPGAIQTRLGLIAFKMHLNGEDVSKICQTTKISEFDIEEILEMHGRAEKEKDTERQRKMEEKKEKKRREEEEEKRKLREYNKEMSTTTLSVEQLCALQQFEDEDNLFITGEGGTGKTLLIKHLVASAKRNFKKVQVCALTGCAALLLGCNARTIHSWSGIRLGKGEPSEIAEMVMSYYKARFAWLNTDILIVDEVSMMSKRIFDILDYVGKRVRKSRLPFGGIQVVFVGDFFQLPPVVSKSDTEEDNTFCFESENWYNTFPMDNHIVLKTIFRQEDPLFRGILSNVRSGTMSSEHSGLLKTYVNRAFDADKHGGVVPTKLFPTKNKVDIINKKMFDALDGDSYSFEYVAMRTCSTYMDGPDRDKDINKKDKDRCAKLLHTNPEKVKYELETLANNCPCDKVLRLKVGANVMCTVNLALEKGICNGSLGKVVRFLDSPSQGGGGDRSHPKIPVVRFSNGVEECIPIKYWQSEEFPVLAVGQVPLCLAWAITIHKIQGATLSMAEIDIGGGIFEYGQTYVALSRVKSLDGLYLSQFDSKKVKANGKVLRFYNAIPEVEYEECEDSGEEGK